MIISFRYVRCLTTQERCTQNGVQPILVINTLSDTKYFPNVPSKTCHGVRGVKWKLRDTPFETDATVTSFSLPDVNVSVEPFRVDLKSPTRGSVGVPFTFDLKISNQSEFSESLFDFDRCTPRSLFVLQEIPCVMSLNSGDTGPTGSYSFLLLWVFWHYRI